MRFRPCIDLHEGRVKQIVGATLSDGNCGESHLRTNFVATESPRYYADLYFRDGLAGAHVIRLGCGNDDAAREALGAHPGFLQIGGGIDAQNAAQWLDAGAAQVIVTSYLFENGDFSPERLKQLNRVVPREKLVIDLSCRRLDDGRYAVACDRWQHITSLTLNAETLEMLAQYCCEFLVHAVSVEGLQQGIDRELVALLAQISPLCVVYAGGIHSMDDIREIASCGQGKIDFTVGSALDIFGGKFLKYEELKQYNH